MTLEEAGAPNPGWPGDQVARDIVSLRIVDRAGVGGVGRPLKHDAGPREAGVGDALKFYRVDRYLAHASGCLPLNAWRW